MSEKVQGTIVIDGLIEGKCPDFGDIEDRLRQWKARAKAKGLDFSLEIEGRTFSVLADNRPISAADLGPDPADSVAELLRDLLVIFPPGQRASLVSSIRSIEYGQNVEIQTVYAIGPDGRIETRQRTVDAQTTAPPKPLTGSEKLKLAGLGLVAALLVFAVTAVFIDYGEVFSDLWDTVVPFDTDAVTVETGRFAKYFTVEKKAVTRGKDGKYVVLTVKRTEAFPRNDKDIADLLAKARQYLDDARFRNEAALATVQALARGYVRCEMFDREGKFLSFADTRITGLRSAETVELALPMPPKNRLAHISIGH